jgi:hypothetical protein
MEDHIANHANQTTEDHIASLLSPEGSSSVSSEPNMQILQYVRWFEVYSLSIDC